MPQNNSFIPEPWCETDEPELGWLYNTGSVAQALAYGQLFWPRFFQHDDCVFLRLDLEKYESWMKETNGNKTQVEATLNHRHVADFFEDAESVSHELLVTLGRQLREAWTAKLRIDFPGRRFEIEFDETAAVDAIDYEITFYQPR